MAAKLNNDQSVTRELDVTLKDNSDNDRALVAELKADGKVTLRLKGMKRTVTVDLLAAMELERDEEAVVVMADQPMTAKKRTVFEHLQGK